MNAVGSMGEGSGGFAPEKDDLGIVSNWLCDQQEEAHMEDDHLPMWERIISKMSESSLSGAHVLDFGCNRGGFLQALYRRKPFEYGLGIDIAEDSVAFAKRRVNGTPVEYRVCDSLSKISKTFDISFSYEVIYLLPNLEQHARDMHKLLKEGGAYYFATGCHTDYPGWERCKEELLKCTNIIPNDYSLSDYRNAFTQAGFEVSACRLQLDSFVRVDLYPEYFPKVEDSLDYFEKYITIFRCQKALCLRNKLYT